jgi:hypothetical protein
LFQILLLLKGQHYLKVSLGLCKFFWVLLEEMLPDLFRRAGLGSAVQAGEAEAESPKCSCMQSIAGNFAEN